MRQIAQVVGMSIDAVETPSNLTDISRQLIAGTKNKKRINPKAGDFNNQVLIVIAAYLAEAQFRYINMEDIAMKANEIAPGKFA